MIKERIFSAVVIAVSATIFYFGFQSLFENTTPHVAEHKAMPPVTPLDSIYEQLVSGDSISILKGLRRVSLILDSICIDLSGVKCLQSPQPEK